MNSVTGIGRSSSAGADGTTVPLATSSGGQATVAGVDVVCTTTGFRSTCCTWCAANTSSLHSIPLWAERSMITLRCHPATNILSLLVYYLMYTRAASVALNNTYSMVISVRRIEHYCDNYFCIHVKKWEV